MVNKLIGLKTNNSYFRLNENDEIVIEVNVTDLNGITFQNYFSQQFYTCILFYPNSLMNQYN